MTKVIFDMSMSLDAGASSNPLGGRRARRCLRSLPSFYAPNLLEDAFSEFALTES
jgi:hypothetical protein